MNIGVVFLLVYHVLGSLWVNGFITEKSPKHIPWYSNHHSNNGCFHITTIDYLRVLIIEIGSTMILMVFGLPRIFFSSPRIQHQLTPPQNKKTWVLYDFFSSPTKNFIQNSPDGTFAFSKARVKGGECRKFKFRIVNAEKFKNEAYPISEHLSRVEDEHWIMISMMVSKVIPSRWFQCHRFLNVWYFDLYLTIPRDLASNRTFWEWLKMEAKYYP